jgi:hypothetical protein
VQTRRVKYHEFFSLQGVEQRPSLLIEDTLRPLDSITILRCRLKDAIKLNHSLLPHTCDFGSGDIAGEPDPERKQNDYDCVTFCELHYYLSRPLTMKTLLAL